MDKEKDKIIEKIYQENFEEEVIDTDEADIDAGTEKTARDMLEKRSSASSAAFFITIVIIIAFIVAFVSILMSFKLFVI